MITPEYSFCIPVHNEAGYLIRNLKNILSKLDTCIGKNKYEVIIVENGSSDDTSILLKSFQYKNIKPYFIKERGVGTAFHQAILKSRAENIIFNAIDLPFGTSDLVIMKRLKEKADIIFGSKAHRDSIVKRSYKRNIYSYFYRSILKILFNIKIKDPQGSVFMKKTKVLRILKYCDAKSAFFTTQLAIYGGLAKLKMIEIPVTMNDEPKRKSKYSLLRDGTEMFVSMISEYFKVRSIKSKDIVF